MKHLSFAKTYLEQIAQSLVSLESKRSLSLGSIKVWIALSEAAPSKKLQAGWLEAELS